LGNNVQMDIPLEEYLVEDNIYHQDKDHLLLLQDTLLQKYLEDLLLWLLREVHARYRKKKVKSTKMVSQSHGSEVLVMVSAKQSR